MAENKNTSEKPSWLHINDDLKEAMTIWEEISVSNVGKLSPEQEQFEKMKTLLGELRDKIEQFK